MFVANKIQGGGGKINPWGRGGGGGESTPSPSRNKPCTRAAIPTNWHTFYHRTAQLATYICTHSHTCRSMTICRKLHTHTCTYYNLLLFFEATGQIQQVRSPYQTYSITNYPVFLNIPQYSHYYLLSLLQEDV